MSIVGYEEMMVKRVNCTDEVIGAEGEEKE